MGVTAGTNPSVNKKGAHGQIRIDYRKYGTHRLAWLYVTGSFPSGFIDHIDGNPVNNAWENLRLSTRRQNSQNSWTKGGSARSKGVSLTRTGKYKAAIRGADFGYHYLGQFDTEFEAAHAYNKAAVQLYGEFARLNPIGEL